MNNLPLEAHHVLFIIRDLWKIQCEDKWGYHWLEAQKARNGELTLRKVKKLSKSRVGNDKRELGLKWIEDMVHLFENEQIVSKAIVVYDETRLGVSHGDSLTLKRISSGDREGMYKLPLNSLNMKKITILLGQIQSLSAVKILAPY